MQRLVSELRKRRRDQRGFTLIEMLVVISILGILAAIVTMSMVGVANLAQTRADQAELKTVQVALDTMANEQGLDQNGVCSDQTPTQDMGAFPPGAKNSNVGGSGPVPLWPRYIRSPETTHRSYSCDAQGNVTQH